MKIDFVSDLHVNHWMMWTNNQLKWEKRTRSFANKLIENGNGEVLIIAGDFSEWNCQALWVLDECAKQYERVYFTYGNHELYLLTKSQKKKYNDSMGRLDELINLASNIDNVYPLVKTVETYKGKVFAGDVMWYLPKSMEDWNFFRNVSNDSEHIFINGYSREDAVRKMWKESMDWYETIEDKHIDVFVSHVPPIHNPYSPFDPNALYMVDVPFINTENWICGHDHMQRQFVKAGVNFHMNAIGYPQHYNKYPKRNVVPQGEIDDYKTFGIKTFDV